ncbi:MAG: hypothetical protein ABL901_18515 [Hyphomicrobiaceae bacterium]
MFESLNTLIDSSPRGFSVEMGDHGEVLLHRRGHVRGFWLCHDGQFAWTPAGYSEPAHFAPGIDAAVAYTQTSILPR